MNYKMPIFGNFNENWSQEIIDTLTENEKFLFNFYEENGWFK